MDHLVELGLRAPGQPPAPSRPATTEANNVHLTSFIDRLLTVVQALAPEAEARDMSEFQSKLSLFRRRLVSPSDAATLADTAEACVRACEQYFRSSRRYHTAREAELTELIGILRDAAGVLVGDSAAFNDQVISSSERFNSLVQLDDLRDLKRRIATEVSTLRRAVEDKQKRDEQSYAQLTSRIEALQSRLVEAEEEASLDALTRVPNRASFDRALERLAEAAQRSGTALALAMVDIDNFKQVNDTHGHQIGDRVLLCTAQLLGRSLRQSDVVARFGGEEFAVILTGATMDQAEQRLRQVLKEIAATTFEYEANNQKNTVRFSASCGLAELGSNDTLDALVRRADEGLYEAKRKGKNRVVARRRSLFGGLLSR